MWRRMLVAFSLPLVIAIAVLVWIYSVASSPAAGSTVRGVWIGLSATAAVIVLFLRALSGHERARPRPTWPQTFGIVAGLLLPAGGDFLFGLHGGWRGVVLNFVGLALFATGVVPFLRRTRSTVR